MGVAKPCLGYPSRTEAVHALRCKGLTTPEIAARIGIEPKTVTALERDAYRSRARETPTAGAIRMSKITDHFDQSVVLRLRPHAAVRDVSVERLIKQLVETIAADGMVGAVLDDGRR